MAIISLLNAIFVLAINPSLRHHYKEKFRREERFLHLPLLHSERKGNWRVFSEN